MIDLRSDILAGVPDASVAAFSKAAAEPQSFDVAEDPHERALETELAALFGFEDGLFVPTGTMANQIAVRIWSSPGEMILADREAHIATSEAASTAGLNGAALHLLDGVRGHLEAQTVARALEALPRSRADRGVSLVWLENTHNRAGGTVMPNGWTRAVAAVAVEHGIPVHLDGARIWNAIAGGRRESMPSSQIARDAASVVSGASSFSVNLNKAAGAPAGSLLLGDRGFIDEAARVRRMFGGWWRPVGPLAAAARAAIPGVWSRVAADHARSRRFARLLAPSVASQATVSEPDTNIVMLELAEPERVEPVRARLRAAGVRASNYGRGRIRFVFHARIADDDVEVAARAVVEALDGTGVPV